MRLGRPVYQQSNPKASRYFQLKDICRAKLSAPLDTLTRYNTGGPSDGGEDGNLARNTNVAIT